MINDRDIPNSEFATPASRAERLKRIRNLANLSRKDISERCNINSSTYTGYEVARHGGLTKSAAEKIIFCLAKEGIHCTLDWLMYGVGQGPTVQTDYKNIILSLLRTELPSNYKKSEDSERENIIEELMFFRSKHKNTIDLIVNDDSMAPHYQTGDYVAGLKRFKQDIASVISYPCIVQTSIGLTLFRYIKNKTTEGKYTLSCLNINTEIAEPVMYNVELVSAAPVIWHRSRNP